MAITVDSRQARRPGRMPTAPAARVGERARAFAAARRHSRLVVLLRVLCPLTAAGILIAYVAIAFFSWQLNAGKFKVDAVQITADDLTMKDVRYADVTSDGRYEVRARRAIVTFDRRTNAPIKLIDISGDLAQRSGTVTRLKAKHGLYDEAKAELELRDGIEVDGSNGLMARLTRATIYSKEGKVVSVEPVRANMPTGSIRAGAMTMTTKTRQVQFRSGVSMRLTPQAGQTLGAGKDARQPVDIRAERLDVDDAAKTAIFRGGVVAVQGETTLRAPYLMVKYEGKAAAALGAQTEPAKKTDEADGARVTFLSARDGVEIAAGDDRRIASDLVDFDVAADTALFTGNVVATQERNVLKGGRLSVDRKTGKSRLEPVGGGHVAVTFHPPDAAAKPRTKARARAAIAAARGSPMGSFKIDRGAPMTVEADLLNLDDAASKAIFNGDVRARQGDMLLRTSQLAAFYSGKAGLGLSGGDGRAGPGPKGKARAEIVRLEARQGVIVTSKEQSATADWADFDIKANTALLGGDVVVDSVVKGAADPLKRNIVTGERLRIDLTTGISRFESDPAAKARRPPRAVVPPAGTPALSSSRPATAGATAEERFSACAPGKQCALIFPEQVKQRAREALKKRAPGVNVP